MAYQHIQVPETGEKITVNEDNSISVPDNPIIPYIEGDGIGVDISPVMIAVVDAAIAKAYDGARSISWMEIYTGEKAAELYDGDWFPEETLDAIKTYSVAIKGPLTTPVGGGFRSLNVALRQELVQDVASLISEINEDGVSILLVEQNAAMALDLAEHGYVMENGKIVLDGTSDELRADKDIQEFYLGFGAEGQRSYRDVKLYRRRKRWLS